MEGSTLNLYSVKAFPSTGPFQDELLAAVVGDRGTMMITTDMGEYWKPKPSCTTRQLNDVHFRYLPKTESDGRVSIDIGSECPSTVVLDARRLSTHNFYKDSRNCLGFCVLGEVRGFRRLNQSVFRLRPLGQSLKLVRCPVRM